MSTPQLVAFASANPGSGEALLLLAERMEKAGRTEEAVQDYVQAGRILPHAPAAWAGAVRTALQGGHLHTALHIAAGGAQKLPHSARVQSALGDALAAAGEWEQALAAYQRAVQYNAALASGWQGLARAALHRGNLQLGLQAARRAVRLQPANPASKLLLARLLRKSGHPNAALQQVKPLPFSPAAAAEECRDVADAADSAQKQASAIERIRKLMPLLQGSPQLFTARRRLADLLLEQGRPAEAAVLLQLALQMQPGSMSAQYALGRAMALQGKTAEAKKLLAKFRAQSRVQRSISRLQMRLGRQPDNVLLLNRLAAVYASQKQVSQAMILYQRSIQLNPVQPGVQHQLRLLENSIPSLPATPPDSSGPP